MKPTITDVAQRAGVSKGAVSFALNGRDGVSARTRERILAAALEMGWQPSHSARALSTARAMAFGLVLFRDADVLRSDPFFTGFLAGVESALAPQHYSLLLRFVTDPDDERAAYTGFARTAQVDGVILADLRVDDVRPELVQTLGLPAVTLNRAGPKSPIPAVLLDDLAGTRQAARLLIRLGHRRLGQVTGPPEYLHVRRRRDAVRRVAAAAGLRPVVVRHADFTAAGGAAATRELLETTEPPTAILYDNDLMAAAGMSQAIKSGRAVPADLSVVGFDDAELSAHLHPTLTTVHTDAPAWGAAAAAALLRLIDGEVVADSKVSPSTLVERESTGPLPGTAAPH